MSDEKPFAAEDAEEAAPVIPNAADHKRHKRIKDAAKRAENERAEFWKAIFSTKIGRREMWELLEGAGAFKPRFAFRGPAPDPLATFFDAGTQSFGFRMYLAWTKLCPEGVIAMMMENHPDLRPELK